jgi:hypothetical protein
MGKMRSSTLSSVEFTFVNTTQSIDCGTLSQSFALSHTLTQSSNQTSGLHERCHRKRVPHNASLRAQIHLIGPHARPPLHRWQTLSPWRGHTTSPAARLMTHKIIRTSIGPRWYSHFHTPQLSIFHRESLRNYRYRLRYTYHIRIPKKKLNTKDFTAGGWSIHSYFLRWNSP